MAAPEEFEVRECLRVHLIVVVRFLESGNHDSDTFDYTVFRLDWVLNVLARYLDTEGTGAGARRPSFVKRGKWLPAPTIVLTHFMLEVFLLNSVDGQG